MLHVTQGACPTLHSFTRPTSSVSGHTDDAISRLIDLPATNHLVVVSGMFPQSTIHHFSQFMADSHLIFDKLDSINAR